VNGTRGVCSIDGCGRQHEARGWCKSHYLRWYSFGDPVRTRPTALDRLMARSMYMATERSAEIGDCLVWLGGASPLGYGHIRVHGRVELTHRAAWVARHGEPPPDKPCVLHHCDNPPCFRDDHLWLGTKGDNNNDRDAKGRNAHTLKTHCPVGHEYTPENTYSFSRRRTCRACRIETCRRYHARQRGD
jgi:hypothetical protein